MVILRVLATHVEPEARLKPEDRLYWVGWGFIIRVALLKYVRNCCESECISCRFKLYRLEFPCLMLSLPRVDTEIRRFPRKSEAFVYVLANSAVKSPSLIGRQRKPQVSDMEKQAFAGLMMADAVDQPIKRHSKTCVEFCLRTSNWASKAEGRYRSARGMICTRPRGLYALERAVGTCCE